MSDPVEPGRVYAPFRRLLAVVEGCAWLLPLSRYALRAAAPDAALKLMSVACDPRQLFPLLTLDYRDWSDAHHTMEHAGETVLAEVARQVRRPGCIPETELLDLSVHGTSAAIAVSRAADRWRADLIAVASAPRQSAQAAGYRLDPEALAAVARCPVLSVPPALLQAGSASLTRVLVAVDGSDTSMDALRVAAGMLQPDMQLRVVHVVERAPHLRVRWPYVAVVEEGMRIMERAGAVLQDLGPSGGTALLETSVDAETIAATLAREADRWGADLIVMGTHGRHVIPRWLPGGVARGSLRSAAHAVLVCPPGVAAATACAALSGAALTPEPRGREASAVQDDAVPPLFL